MACGEYSQIFKRKIRTLSWLHREKIFRSISIKYTLRKILVTSFIQSDYVPQLHKAGASFFNNKLPTISCLTKQVRRCHNSGRTQFVLQRYGLSRMMFRKYIRLGKLSNTVRHTW